MKTKVADNILITNTTNASEFKFSASAKMFKILSSSIYERKIEAIVRELSCNAYDSHVQAGYPDRPFKITLPNEWVPEFVVEDFGVGLDNEEILNIYTTYGESTKTESNDMIGAFGLGSKTPFAYTDTFNIRARKDGVERTYNAYIGMNGIPSVTKLSEHETEEPNGVKISVPVREIDFTAFKRDVVKVMAWFTVLPEIVGQEVQIDNSMALALLEDRVFIPKYSDYSQKDTIHAVMGNVCYVVSNVSRTLSGKLSKGSEKFIEHNSIYIRFDIGDLEVAASREVISFEEDTTDRFVEAVEDAISGFSKETQDKIDNEADSVFAAKAIVEEDVGLWSLSMFTYQGVDIDLLLEQSFTNHLKYLITEYAGTVMDMRAFKSFKSYGKVEVTGSDMSYRWGDHKFSEQKFQYLAFYDIGTNNTGYARNARIVMREKSTSGLLIFVKGLNDKAKNALVGEFGSMVCFYSNDIQQELFKENLRKQRENARLEAILDGRPVKAPAAKIKKQEVRVIGAAGTGVGSYQRLSDKGDHKYEVSHLQGKKVILVERAHGSVHLSHKCIDSVNPTISIEQVSPQNVDALLEFTGADALLYVKRTEEDRTIRILDPMVEWVNTSKLSKVMDQKILTYLVKRMYTIYDEEAIKKSITGVASGYLVDRMAFEPFVESFVAAYEKTKHICGSGITFPNVQMYVARMAYQKIKSSIAKTKKELYDKYPLLHYISGIEDYLIEEYLDLVDRDNMRPEKSCEEEEKVLDYEDVA